MAKIRHLEIHRFKGIKYLNWNPSPGINCLAGPGDSSKSTILEAIEIGLGPKRNYSFSDADFYRLNTDQPIIIDITIGDLDNELKRLDSHGLYMRGFDVKSNRLEDEPGQNLEVVLTIRFQVNEDLEPSWTLFSERSLQTTPRHISWSERQSISCSRIGTHLGHDLSWRKGSVLNKISDEKANTGASFAKANRDARSAFGKEANEQLKNAREIVLQATKEFGVYVGNEVQALLDIDSFSMNGGAISLHNEIGVPLKNLGMGSTRMLVTGLQKKVSSKNIILIDELEHGLEPHRVIRLLHSIGCKEEQPKQTFLTTHSPIALRELSDHQLFIIRSNSDQHYVLQANQVDEAQSMLRLYPEAFLAKSVIVCEGASEVGLIRGIDQYRVRCGQNSITACAFSWVDGGGSSKFLKKALTLRKLGYSTAIICDNDVPLDQKDLNEYQTRGGYSYWWDQGNFLEAQIYKDLDENSMKKLIELAVNIHGDNYINDSISSASKGKYKLVDFSSNFDGDKRNLLTAMTQKHGWFKTVTYMETLATEIIGPQLHQKSILNDRLNHLFSWAVNG